MTKIPTVYYGALESSPMALYADVENLLKHLKNTHPLKESEYFKCPSFISWAKDKLVIKSPADFSLPVNPLPEYTQFLATDFYFFADREVNLTAYPPFLDMSDIHGVVGEFDISKWLRSINATAAVFKEELKVKQDQAVLYVGFDRPVKLEKITYPKEIVGVTSTLMSYKNINMKGRSLTRLYKSFMEAKTNRTVLKMIKDYNDI